jgi:hypothetical protein
VFPANRRRISMIRPKTKILVDGSDPQETRHVKELLGFVDGQATNPKFDGFVAECNFG